MKGDLNLALRYGMAAMERAAQARDAVRQAALGQIVGRAMLAAGRAEEAEEAFQDILKCYEAISRNAVRWHASLDQAAIAMYSQKWGRAAESANLVADDESAPAEVRVEAMAMLAVSLHRMGEHRRALSTLGEAAIRAEEAQLPAAAELVQLLRLELIARFRFEIREGLGDYALLVAEGPTDQRDAPALCAALEQAAAGLDGDRDLLAQGLRALARLLSDDIATPSGVAQQRQALKWLQDRGFGAAAQDALRMDTVLALLSHDAAGPAADLLGPLAFNDQAAQRHRLALELKYCSSRLHALGGRQGEALRAYKEFAKEALYRSTRERSHLPHSRFLERQAMAEKDDATMLRLPMRYRHAYRFIVERLDDRKLSIKQVAAHIDVTERALQMAFRTYVGMTPAQLIRHMRMEGIRSELRDGGGRASVLKTAARWGMSNRSTLAHAYRQQFAETPTATLRNVA
ncbi:helix-turn-helix transcriptional regulator [Aquincola sp. S2]|uniref:Helix-turn-helix transcriptional regulator n=1 Tax=Pseudaquabacterium terrae TaxID=2732868 RepID=A0ABX2EIN4_9BURK|nr:helix-turn-helix transcriptional regulator [Aquabacterium terrae]NRF68495.1 helix-turn-helix transcriptional regulator [Aquabacterium terrae]